MRASRRYVRGRLPLDESILTASRGSRPRESWGDNVWGSRVDGGFLVPCDKRTCWILPARGSSHCCPIGCAATVGTASQFT
jgi:hypothetical protein